MTTACYLYGITCAQVQIPSNLRGFQGIPLEVVRGDGVCAVISRGNIDLGQDPSAIMQLYQAQQQVLLKLEARAVVPARIGSGLDSFEAVQALLEYHREALLEQLKGVADKAQFNLRVIWKLDAEIKNAATNRDILEFRAELAGRTMLLEDQVRIGELIAMHLEHERQRLLDKVLSRLEPSLSEYGLASRDTEDTAFNLVLLAARDSHAGLLSLIQQIADERLQFELSSALPIHAFRLLEVVQPSRQDLEKARLALRLPANTPSAPLQVQRAYKQLALEKHPDRNPNNPFATEEMIELSWARDLLEVAGQGVGLRVQKVVNS